MGRSADVRDSAVLPVRLAGPAMLTAGDTPVGVSRVWWDGARLLIDVVATRPHPAELEGRRSVSSMSMGFGEGRARLPPVWEGPTLGLPESAFDIVQWNGASPDGDPAVAPRDRWRVRYCTRGELAPRFGREPFLVTWPAAGLPPTEVVAPDLRVGELPTPLPVWQAPVTGAPVDEPPAPRWAAALLRSQRGESPFPFGVPLIDDPVVLARTDQAAVVLEDIDGTPAGLILWISGYATRQPRPPRLPHEGLGWRQRRAWRRRIRSDLWSRIPRVWVTDTAGKTRSVLLLAGGGGDRHAFRCRGRTTMIPAPTGPLTVIVSWQALELPATATTLTLSQPPPSGTIDNGR